MIVDLYMFLDYFGGGVLVVLVCVYLEYCVVYVVGGCWCIDDVLGGWVVCWGDLVVGVILF